MRDLVKNRVAHFVDAVQKGERSRECDPSMRVIASPKSSPGVIEAKTPPGQSVGGDQLSSKTSSFMQVHDRGELRRVYRSPQNCPRSSGREIGQSPQNKACASVGLGVLQDTARTREALPSLCVALGAGSRNRYDVVRLKTTGAALEPEHWRREGVGHRTVRIVGREMSFTSKSFHADRHTVNLLPVVTCDSKAPYFRNTRASPVPCLPSVCRTAGSDGIFR
jgi:hypothetical protein